MQCNEALSICGDVQAQFAYAPSATNYELYWDAGTGSLPDILVYSGSLPSADITISSQTLCYQFRVRGTTSDGMSDFGEIRFARYHYQCLQHQVVSKFKKFEQVL